MMRILIGFLMALTLLAHGAGTRILSFDGGGVRGVVSLEFLLQLEQQTGLNPCSDFDVYAGTSTGAMIASMLACGVEAKTVMEGYQKLSKVVFSSASHFSLFKPKYDHNVLKTELEAFFDRCKISKELLLKDIPKKLVILTVNLDDSQVGRWRLQVLENVTTGSGETTLIEALLESTAAPTYFSSETDHVDGGIGMNDPSLAALATVYDSLQDDLRDFSILSIGTGFTRKKIKEDENWGILSWLFKGSKTSGHTPLFDLLFDVQEQIPSQFCHQLLGDRYLKIDLPLLKEFALDDYRQISAMIEETDEYIEQNSAIWDTQKSWVQKTIESSLH